VRGFVEIETFTGSTLSGDEVVTVPYSYTVG
jgi:hypothetical protein